MIIYNGQALEAVAPIKIEDVRVSPIATRRHGSGPCALARILYAWAAVRAP